MNVTASTAASLYCRHYRTAFSEVAQNGLAVCNRDVTSVRWLETKSAMMLRSGHEDRLLLFVFGTADEASSDYRTLTSSFFTEIKVQLPFTYFFLISHDREPPETVMSHPFYPARVVFDSMVMFLSWIFT